MTHPTIEPGLVVRYRRIPGNEPYDWKRVVKSVDGRFVELLEDRDRYGNLLSVEHFWGVFEPVEYGPEPEPVPDDDDPAESAPSGVWVTSSTNPDSWDVLVESIHDNELAAWRAIDFEKTQPRVTFVEFGSDVHDVIRATR